MNRLKLKTRILEKLNESTTNPTFWSLSQIDDIINEGAEVLAEESRLVKRTVTTTVRPGTSYYQTRGIAPDMMGIYPISLPDQRLRLRAVSPLQLAAYQPLVDAVRGTSTGSGQEPRGNWNGCGGRADVAGGG